MPDTTTEALYKVGQLVEWRGGEDRPFERTGRVTRVFSTSDPAAGGWQYAIEAAGPRGMENPGKWQTNVRPFFEAGDVVRVSIEPRCEEVRDQGGAPTGAVSHYFYGQEATVTGERLRSNYEVRLPNRDTNWIAPEFLTLVRKAGEPAPSAPSYRYAADGWRPQVGDHIEVRIHASAQWQDYGTITDVGTDLSYAETDLPSGITGHVTRDHYEAGHVRLVVEAPGETTLPTTFSEGWRPQVGDVVRLDYEDGREVTVRHLYPNSDDFGFDYSEQRWGSTVSNTYVRDDQVRLVRRPGAEPAAQPAAPEPWDITKVQVGDKVEVYAGAGGYPASSPEAAAHREPRLSWQEGVVMSVDSGDRSLTLRVRANGVDSWWHYNENVRPVQTAAPAAAPAPDVQAAIDKALAEYKAQVRDVALKAAQENDWCSQTEACLKELGIDPQTQYAAEVTVTFKVSAKVAEDYTRSGIENPARFLKDHLTPTLTTRYGLSSADVAIERVQINNVTKN